MNSEMRGVVIGLHHVGKSSRQISATTGVSKTCIQKIITRYLEGGMGAVHDKRMHNGAARKTTDEQDFDIVRSAMADNHEPRCQIPVRMGLNVSDWVIKNRLGEVALKSRISAKTIGLTDGHREQRVGFALQYLPLTADDWGSTIFMDEKVFASDKDGRYRVLREDGARFDPENCRPDYRSGHVTTAFHGWIGKDCVGQLTETTRRMNAHEYIDILQNSVIPSVRAVYPADEVPVLMIVEDNSPVHTARIVRDWYAAQPDLIRVDWPAKSPDLNPMENMWSQVVRDFRPVAGETVVQLKQRVRVAWEAMRANPGYTSAIVGSMPRRMRKVIDADGYTIDY